MPAPTYINDTPYSIAPLAGRIRFPKPSMTVAVKGTFDMTHRGVATPGKDGSFRGDEFADDSNENPLTYAADLVPHKPRTDVLLFGTAHAPGGRPTQVMQVRATVGPNFGKAVTIIGSRTMKGGVPSDPEPFKSVPLGWAESFGGPRHQNRVGTGAGGTEKLPRIDSAVQVMRSPDESPEPVGFAPLHPNWPQRKKNMGTYDKKWERERWPYPPADFDWGYYNAAPPDQQLDQPLKGDEAITITHMHPQHSPFTCKLPGVRVRAFYRDLPLEGEEVRDEVPMKIDTVVVDMDALTVSVVWRGLVDIDADELSSLGGLLVVEERLDEEAKPKSEYLPRFDQGPAPLPGEAAAEEEAAAQADDAGAEDAGSDADADGLAMPEEQPEILDKTDKGELPAGEAMAGILEQGGGLAALGQAAKLIPAGLEAKALADPDVVAALQEINQALQQGDQAMASAQGLLDSGLPDAGANILDAVKAAPASPADPLAEIPGKIEEMQAMLQEKGVELPPDMQAKIDEFLKSPELEEAKAKMAEAQAEGVDPNQNPVTNSTTEEPPPPPDEAAVKEAAATDGTDDGGLAGKDMSGAQLAGSDFSGQDLSGAVFTGADFTGANLAGATLTGANLSNANLTSANLTGTVATNADFTGANFTSANLTEANFTTATLDSATLAQVVATKATFTRAFARNISAPGATFDESTWERTIADQADLSQCTFAGANLENASFKSAKLAEASFAGTILTDARFNDAGAEGISFKGAKADGAVFIGANLQGCDFTDVTLYRAQMMDINGREANFFSAIGRHCEFARANLTEAKIMNADFMRANFREAQLTGADMTGSNFYEADLWDAVMLGTKRDLANFEGTRIGKADVPGAPVMSAEDATTPRPNRTRRAPRPTAGSSASNGGANA